jgi:crotonobetainyl-CoA:carnitine CoA-transferase CaiB-like acyl-CoA transferase
MTPALDGLRVLEIADPTGEWAGKLVADMGADVIKLEPIEGAPSRQLAPFADDGTEVSLHFLHYNTGKRSVAADAFDALLAGADVLLHAGPARDWTETMRAHPRLVVASITPWGADGPYAHYASGDLIQMAMGGIVSSCGYDDHDLPPVRPGPNHSHHIAGWHAVIGILTALHGRETTGRGQLVDVPIHDCVAVCTEFAATYWFYARTLVKRQTSRHATPNPTPRSLYPARDRRFVNLTGLTPAALDYFANWAEEAGVDLTPFKDDEGKLVTGPGLGHAVRAITSIMEADEIWLAGQSLGLTWGSVRRPEDWLDDPHAQARGFFVEVEHPQLSRPAKFNGLPFAFERHPGRVTRAPELGEHNGQAWRER